MENQWQSPDLSQEQSAPETETETTASPEEGTPSPVESKKPSWEDILRDPDYRKCYDAAVQSIVQHRLRNRMNAEETLQKMAPVLEALRELKEENLPHRPLEILFTTAEEAYTVGASAFDFSKVRAKEAFAFDCSDRMGSYSATEPTLLSFAVTVTGRAAHAGFEPEQGIHAIKAAAAAVAEIRTGHIDEETTVNIGTFNGGKARNIVPDRVVITGEIRSLDDAKADAQLQAVRESFERHAREIGAEVSFSSDRSFHAYKVERDDTAAVHFEQAVKKAGLAPEWAVTFGGSDNNRLREHGIRGLVIGCGYWHAHSTSEYAAVSEMEKSVRILLNLVEGG